MTETTEEQARLDLIERLGCVDISNVVNQEGGSYVTPDPFAVYPSSPMSRHEFLAAMHSVLHPRTYFEVGVESGASLSLSKTKTIAVDPEFHITRSIQCDFRTFIETSDSFFKRIDGFDHFEGLPIDLAFIDGMHLAEFALRDFINTEKHSAPGSVVVFDDVLPRNSLEAYRIRRTTDWAGDVYKIYQVLRRHRPDLVTVLCNTSPTGTLVVTNLDPASTVLLDQYDEIEHALTTPDPQTVPDAMLSRSISVDPEALLASDVWPQMIKLREATTAQNEQIAKTASTLRKLPQYGHAASEVVLLRLRAAECNERASRIDTENSRLAAQLEDALAEIRAYKNSRTYRLASVYWGIMRRVRRRW